MQGNTRMSSHVPHHNITALRAEFAATRTNYGGGGGGAGSYLTVPDFQEKRLVDDVSV